MALGRNVATVALAVAAVVGLALLLFLPGGAFLVPFPFQEVPNLGECRLAHGTLFGPSRAILGAVRAPGS